MNTFILKTMILFILVSVSAYAEEIGSYDNDAPDKDYIWVDSYELADGELIKGFYRERSREGFTWRNGYYNDAGEWTDARWVPNQKRHNHIWVPGSVGPDDYWVVGHWRQNTRVGYTWVAPTIVAGVWLRGYWKPVVARAGFIWVPGDHNNDGDGVVGHWRKEARPGYRWARGHWRYGIWYPGFWSPLKPRSGHVWVGGFFGPTVWVTGFWRPTLKVGFHWRKGYWGTRGWVVGGWRKGPRVIARRNFPRVHVASHMHKQRIKHHRKIKHPKQFAKGKAQTNYGKKQQRVGQRIEYRGQNTGNKRLQKKGVRLQNKGKRNQNKGKFKKHSARR